MPYAEGRMGWLWNGKLPRGSFQEPVWKSVWSMVTCCAFQPGRGSDTLWQTWRPPGRRICKIPSLSNLPKLSFAHCLSLKDWLTLRTFHCAIFNNDVAEFVPMLKQQSDLKRRSWQLFPIKSRLPGIAVGCLSGGSQERRLPVNCFCFFPNDSHNLCDCHLFEPRPAAVEKEGNDEKRDKSD